MLHEPELSESPVAIPRRYAGLDVVVDRPVGHLIEGVDAFTGEPYRVVYQVDYGYLPETDGGDGEGLDVFLGPDESLKTVLVVEHLKDRGSFDEWKSFLGFANRESAAACYLAHYPARWMGSWSTTSLDALRARFGSGDRRMSDSFASTLVRCDLAVGDVHVAASPPAKPAPRREETTMAEISTKTRNAIPSGSFALPAQRKYPLENSSHVRNAAARLEQMKKAGKISPADYSAARARIAAAAKKFGIESEYNASDDKFPAKRGPRKIRVHADIAPGGQLHVRHMSDGSDVVRFPPILIPPEAT